MEPLPSLCLSTCPDPGTQSGKSIVSFSLAGLYLDTCRSCGHTTPMFLFMIITDSAMRESGLCFICSIRYRLFRLAGIRTRCFCFLQVSLLLKALLLISRLLLVLTWLFCHYLLFFV